MAEKQKAVVENGVQKIRITAEKGYSPKEFQLQKGIPDLPSGQSIRLLQGDFV